MAQAGKFDDSDSADDLGIMNVPMPLSHREPCFPSDQHPIFPPPPTAAAAAAGMKKAKKSTARRAIRPKPEPLISLPPVPPVPVLARTASGIPNTPKQLDTTAAAAAAPARTTSRRKTLLERIEGWWDLGLLDKRQTLFRAQSKTMAEQKL
ncbi:hypothetical protein PWT90_01572 [Aphanocladium album]|nr:hypothetical protein PWT90_01572 [Aphanocladium album]